MMRRVQLSALLALCCIVCGTLWLRSDAGQKNVPVVLRAQRFELVDKNNKVCAVLQTDKYNQPQLNFWDNHGKPRLEMTVRANGEVYLNLNDADDKQSVTLSAASRASGLYVSGGYRQIKTARHWRTASLLVEKTGAAELKMNQNFFDGWGSFANYLTIGVPDEKSEVQLDMKGGFAGNGSRIRLFVPVESSPSISVVHKNKAIGGIPDNDAK